jgi:hypothetical protein
MTIDQISVFIENKQGTLAEVIGIMGGAGIDLRALSLADTADFGVLRVIVNDPKKAHELLKAANFVVSVTPVLAVPIADVPGGLAKVLRALAAENVSVEYAYASITRKIGDAYVVFRVEDNAKAASVLAAQGIDVVAASDLFGA